MTDQAANGAPSELDQATEWLQRLTRDPMADAAPGRLLVLSASAPPRSRYGECTLELRVQIPGVPPTTVTYAAVFPRTHWPQPGAVVPARIARENPQVFEAVWEAACSPG